MSLDANASQSPIMPPEPHDGQEAAWVAAAAQGDEAAFLCLVERYEERVLQLAAKFARDRDEVRDLAQEIFLTIWRSLPGYQARAPFEHWLTRVAMNRCKRYLRKTRRSRETEVLTAEPSQEADTSEKEGADAREILVTALRQVSPDDALMITLKEIEGRSVAEVAALMGLTEGAVKVRAHRARSRLRTQLEKLGYTPDST